MKAPGMMRLPTSRDRILHLAFDIGVWFKGLDGILEVIGGTLLLVFSRATLIGLVRALTRHELQEDPTDWVATHLRAWLPHFLSTTQTFAGAYLLGHGAIKVFLVWGGLLRRKRWAFPTAIIFIGAFIGYQLQRVLHRFSIGLVALTLIDCLVLVLIWREYLMVRRARR